MLLISSLPSDSACRFSPALSAPIILSVEVLYAASSFDFHGADVCETQGDSCLKAPL